MYTSNQFVVSQLQHSAADQICEAFKCCRKVYLYALRLRWLGNLFLFLTEEAPHSWKILIQDKNWQMVGIQREQLNFKASSFINSVQS